MNAWSGGNCVANLKLRIQTINTLEPGCDVGTHSAENRDIMQFIHENHDKITRPIDNIELCKSLNIAPPNGKHQNLHDYKQKEYRYMSTSNWEDAKTT